MSKRERIEALEARVAVAEKRLTALEIEPSDPEPVPQWRVSVDSWAESGVMGEAEDPLAAVLWLLHRVSLLQGVDHSEVADALARIVAVCEGQVGDGWKADPDQCAPDDPEGYEGGWMGLVLYMFADGQGQVLWSWMGNIAAAWLRDLTDGAS